MGKLWQKTQDNNGVSLLKEVDLATLRITAPTIVYLSGFLTNNNRPEYIAGSIKRLQDLTKDHPLPVQPQIYAWSHSGLRNLFNLAAYDLCPGTRSSKAGYDLSKAVLMPLLAKDFAVDAKGNISGAPLPAAEAKEKLKNVTLFGYSAGSVVAQEIFNATLKMMKTVGYNEQNARQLLNEVVLISVGTVSRPSKETNRFTTVYLAATNDRLTRAKNWAYGTLGTLLRSTFGHYAQKGKDLTIRPLSETSLFITAPVRPSLYEWTYDGNGLRAEKKYFPPLYPTWTLRRSYHELPHYITRDEKNNAFANIVLHAVANAVTRSGKTQTLQLIAASPGTAAGQEASYKAKITEALRPSPKALAS